MRSCCGPARVVDFASVLKGCSRAVATMGLAVCLVSTLLIRGDLGDELHMNPAMDRSAISVLNAQMERGAFTPAFEPPSGYLRNTSGSRLSLKSWYFRRAAFRRI